MIVKIPLVLALIIYIKDVSSASFSRVYVQHGPDYPVENIKHGAPSVSYSPQIAQLTAAPIGSVVPYSANYVPCGTPCVYPSQVASLAPSPNIVQYQPQSLPVVVAPSRSEPSGYEYGYVVYDEQTGDYKVQRELSDGSTVRGGYSFLQPDGFVREVQYIADDSQGFNAVVKNYLPTNVEKNKNHQDAEESGSAVSHDTKDDNSKPEHTVHIDEHGHESHNAEPSHANLEAHSHEEHHEHHNHEHVEGDEHFHPEQHEAHKKHHDENAEPHENLQEFHEKHNEDTAKPQEEQNEGHEKLQEDTAKLHDVHHNVHEKQDQVFKKHHKDTAESDEEHEEVYEGKVEHQGSIEEIHEEHHKPDEESHETDEKHILSEKHEDRKPKPHGYVGHEELIHKLEESVVEAIIEKLQEEQFAEESETTEKVKVLMEPEVTEVHEHHLATVAEHDIENSNILVPYNDIIRCVQAAINGVKDESSPHRPDSPLTYIILNKPC